MTSTPAPGPLPGFSPGWTTATGLADLGELTARWLTGEYEQTPLHGGPPDPETALLIPVLAAANRAGYVTDFSQPGEDWGDGDRQRAAVGDYCDDAIRDRLAGAVAGSDLVLLHERGDSGIQVPVTLDGGAACTWVGGVPASEDIWYNVTLTAGALAALRDSWYVTIVDPVWGRNDLLWPLLTHALDRTVPNGADDGRR